MKWISVLLVAVMALVPSATLWPASADAQPQRNAGGITVPVTGSNSFVGSFTITKFAVQGGKLVALGTLVGTVGETQTPIGITSIAMPVDTAASGGASRAAAAAVGIAQLGECDILHLVLGPLHINLLGLEIDLNQVVLDITAQAGAGNLLGNLLCAIVGLLDPLGPLTGLVALLNQLLALLG